MKLIEIFLIDLSEVLGLNLMYAGQIMEIIDAGNSHEFTHLYLHSRFARLPNIKYCEGTCQR